MLSHDNDINEALRSLMCFRAGQLLEITVFSNLSRAEIYNRKVKGKSIYKIELKCETYMRNN